MAALVSPTSTWCLWGPRPAATSAAAAAAAAAAASREATTVQLHRAYGYYVQYPVPCGVHNPQYVPRDAARKSITQNRLLEPSIIGLDLFGCLPPIAWSKPSHAPNPNSNKIAKLGVRSGQ